MLSRYCLQFSNEWKAKTCAREGKIPYLAAGLAPRGASSTAKCVAARLALTYLSP